MTPEEPEPTDERPAMDRWAIPLFEAAPAEPVPVTEEDYPLRLDAMPLEGFHPKLRYFRDAG
jgi:hypothetical protein